MPDRHRRNPLTVRLPEGERARLKAYAERTGQLINRIVADAVREKLDREDEGGKGAGMSGRVVYYCTGRLALASLDYSAPGRHRHEDGTMCDHPGLVAWAQQVIEVPVPLVARADPIEITQAD